MSTIKSNEVLNRIQTVENVENFNSNIKKLFTPLFSRQARLMRECQLIDDNLNFRYSGEDLFNTCDTNKDNINELLLNGYQFITEDKYIYSDYNRSQKIEMISNPKFNIDRGITEIPFYDGVKDVTLNFAFEDNLIIFFSPTERKILFELQLDPSIIIKDFIMTDTNIYMYLLFAGKYYLVNTNKALKFAGTDPVSFKDIECFYKVSTGFTDLGQIVNVDRDEIMFCDKNLIFTRVTLSKRYFFENEGKVFFTKDETIHSTKELSDGIDFQSEHLFLYDLVSLLGLNDLMDGDNKFIDSTKVKNKHDLFRFKFDDTSNGFINYFDFVNNKKENYKVDFEDSNFFSCHGNFFLENFLDGEYKIQISSTETHRLLISDSTTIRMQLLHKNVGSTFYRVVKDITISNRSGIFYFCNLKIKINGTFDHLFDYEFIFNQITPPDLKINNKKYSLDVEFPDNEDTVEYKLQNNKFLKVNKKLKTKILLNYLDYVGGELKTQPFLIEDGVLKLEEVPILSTDINDLFSSLPVYSDKNYMVDYKNIFEEDITIGSSRQEKELFNMQRLKFNLSVSLNDFS